MEGIFRPGGFVGDPHVHPFQEERFDVLAGTAGFRVGQEQIHRRPGEQITIPAGQAHTFWNACEGEMRVMTEFRPALASTGPFYESCFGLARDGKGGTNGLPSIWQIALQVEEFGDHVRLASPPWPLQRAIFALLRPIARLLGYRRLDYTVSEESSLTLTPAR